MRSTKTRQVEWTTTVVETLLQEIGEFSRRYLMKLEALSQQAPGSDAYIDHWAELAVILEWLQVKIKDVLKEMERLEDTWPD